MAAFPGSCGKLRLPDNFAELLGGREPREVTLREAGAGARRRWDVEVGFDGDGHVYLERGWEEFARDHDMGLDNGSSSAETDIDDEPRSQFTVTLKKCHLGVRKQKYLDVPPAFQSAHGHEERSKVLPPRVRGKPWPANPNRSLLLVVTIAVLLCAMAAPAAASMGPMVGGWEQITDINATDVQEIARWAVAEHARQANDGLQYKRAVSGMEQVVAGANWKLRVAAVNGDGVECVYVAEVFDQPWTHTRTLESFSPAQSAQPGMCTLPPPKSKVSAEVYLLLLPDDPRFTCYYYLVSVSAHPVSVVHPNTSRPCFI